MEFMEYLNILSRRRWLLVSSVVVFLSVAAAYLLLATRLYEADAKLLLVQENGYTSLAGLALDDVTMQALGKTDPVATQMEILRTRPILKEVIARVDLRDHRGAQMEAEDLRERVKLSVPRLTNIIAIRYRHPSPDTAALVVNTLAQVFVENNQRMNQEEMRAAKLFVEGQLKSQRVKLDEAEQALARFKASEKTVSLDQETQIRVSTVAQLEVEKMRLESELKSLRSERDQLASNLAGDEAQLDPHFRMRLSGRERIQGDIAGLQARLGSLAAQIAQGYRELKDLPPLQVELARLTREQSIANALYTNLLSQHEEFQIREAAKVASAKIIEPAVPSARPVHPRVGRTLALALATALFMGAGLALLLEHAQDTPRSVDDIKKTLGTSLLGTIPWFDKETPTFMRDNPNSLPAESVRLIYTSLKFKDVVDRPHLALLTTSAQPGEGKTTLTANLAMAFAAAGRRTALVNLDLRRPAFEKLFQHPVKQGLANLLLGEVEIDDVCFAPDNTANLLVIGSGPVPPNPSELVGSARMKELVARLRERFDVVIFDTPPITMVAETLELTRSMDGLILVSSITETSLRVLRHLHDLLADKDLPLLGVVVNKYGKGALKGYGYYRYGYHGYGYAYGGRDNGKKG